ncbi:DUF4145 domain-containing protein [Vibrio crassostreae]|uniref:DUF4145 domain-containing protein n=1 Tax=Vibrio crassostreae TaxID=246167 RepID=UPI00148DFFDC|nr:DUF4145 domain-containing protein [Vibrio crassostreae]NOH76079.1 DUF4145 domain-containing protein [Vibrio crassostreae]CAK2474296.1 DUF4145 domain-containing protein [Vibrio crassostreae]CAK2783585.1 DUF4145 domain-containing protein [Vibrio crassostreae]CAK3392906.1 DUF4145 domain-containing protein [Vibrio crassostreae]
MSKYYPPIFEEEQFHCIHCGVYAKQGWNNLKLETPQYYKATSFRYSQCHHCEEFCYWYEGRMIIPSEAPVAPPHIDIPAICLDDYNEARDIVARSPRAAAALLRLTIQKLLVELGEKGNNINEDIGSLVNKGLPVEVQQALDYCRVIGNNAVHPGEINLNDDPSIAHSLFEMINFIVEVRISQPKKVAALYNILPEGALKAVEKRDKVK